MTPFRRILNKAETLVPTLADPKPPESIRNWATDRSDCFQQQHAGPKTHVPQARVISDLSFDLVRCLSSLQWLCFGSAIADAMMLTD
jgi:hypothetical protein